MLCKSTLLCINFLDSAVQVFLFGYSIAVYPGTAAWVWNPRNQHLQLEQSKTGFGNITTGSSEAYLPNQAASLIPCHLVSVHNARNWVMSSKLWRPLPCSRMGTHRIHTMCCWKASLPFLIWEWDSKFGVANESFSFNYFLSQSTLQKSEKEEKSS